MTGEELTNLPLGTLIRIFIPLYWYENSSWDQDEERICIFAGKKQTPGSSPTSKSGCVACHPIRMEDLNGKDARRFCFFYLEEKFACILVDPEGVELIK